MNGSASGSGSARINVATYTLYLYPSTTQVYIHGAAGSSIELEEHKKKRYPEEDLTQIVDRDRYRSGEE